jgi:hypothetical protein
VLDQFHVALPVALPDSIAVLEATDPPTAFAWRTTSPPGVTGSSPAEEGSGNGGGAPTPTTVIIRIRRPMGHPLVNETSLLLGRAPSAEIRRSPARSELGRLRQPGYGYLVHPRG